MKRGKKKTPTKRKGKQQNPNIHWDGDILAYPHACRMPNPAPESKRHFGKAAAAPHPFSHVRACVFVCNETAGPVETYRLWTASNGSIPVLRGAFCFTLGLAVGRSRQPNYCTNDEQKCLTRARRMTKSATVKSE